MVLVLPLLVLASPHLVLAQQDEVQEAELNKTVRLIETDDATCVVNDGKLISIELINVSLTVDVWVDRWFMNVQTADHTKQRLSASNPIAELGCSKSNAGPQHWVIDSVKLN